MDQSDNKKQAAGDGIRVAKGAWQFDDAVPGVFDAHVSKSIPKYQYGHDLVIKYAQPFLQEAGRCYELGCSTGMLTAKLAACANPDKSSIIGLDQVSGMIDRAHRRCKDFAHVSFETADIVNYRFQSANVVVCYYTLHFTPLSKRAGIINAVYNALEDNGIFVLFEKIRFSDEQKNREVTDQYHKFKASQGFTHKEIISKAEALEGVLVPQTEQENLIMLGDGGFNSNLVIFEELCWQGYLGVKSSC